MRTFVKLISPACLALAVIAAPPALAQSAGTSFFLTSNGPGKGGDLGGIAGADARTCKNWTRSRQGAAMVGHSDRQGLRDDDASKSWNSSHPSRGSEGGCSQADLKSTGGDGLFYCFAAN